MRNRQRSIGGVTVGNAWMYNNPDLVYPDGHELMSEAELKAALTYDEEEENREYMEHCHEYMKRLFLKDKGY